MTELEQLDKALKTTNIFRLWFHSFPVRTVRTLVRAHVSGLEGCCWIRQVRSDEQ
jgi:hypothetical protein